MTNSNKFLLIFSSAIALSACNSGSSSSSGTNSNVYNGTLIESYSVSLPTGGNLVSTTNMFYATNATVSPILYFGVESNSSNVNITFSVQQTAGSATTANNVSVKSSTIPSITPTTCNFTSQNESCAITLNLNSSAAGTYSITPMIESISNIALSPIVFTVLPQTTYIIANGTYTRQGYDFSPNQLGVLPDCNVAYTTYTYQTVSNGQFCISSDDCIQMIPGTIQNNFIAPETKITNVDNNGVPYSITYTYLGYYNSTYNTSTTISTCPGAVGYDSYTLINQG